MHTVVYCPVTGVYTNIVIWFTFVYAILSIAFTYGIAIFSVNYTFFNAGWYDFDRVFVRAQKLLLLVVRDVLVERYELRVLVKEVVLELWWIGGWVGDGDYFHLFAKIQVVRRTKGYIVFVCAGVVGDNKAIVLKIRVVETAATEPDSWKAETPVFTQKVPIFTHGAVLPLVLMSCTVKNISANAEGVTNFKFFSGTA